MSLASLVSTVRDVFPASKRNFHTILVLCKSISGVALRLFLLWKNQLAVSAMLQTSKPTILVSIRESAQCGCQSELP